jgi:SpoVK/Ycf46/Vps4 family AAA+-type ATPase
LKLHNFRDSIHLKPYTPKFVQPDSVKLERVRLVHGSNKSLASWNIPEISLSVGCTSNSPAVHSSEDSKTMVLLPLGALVPSSCFVTEEGQEDGKEWVRLMPKSKDQSWKRSVLALNRFVVQQSIYHDTRDCGAIHTEPAIVVRGPQEHVGSSDWIAPLTNRVKRFPSVVIKLYGSTGSGKSHSAILLSACASLRFHRPIFYLNCKKLQKTSPKMAGIMGELDSVFRQISVATEAIVVLDDLDSLSPNLLENSESKSSAKMNSANPAAVDQSKVIADRILHWFKTVSMHGRVCLIATCAGLDSVNPVLFRSLNIIQLPVKVPLLSSEAQVDLLHVFMKHQLPSLCIDVILDVPLLSQRLGGFLPLDLEKLSLRASRLCQVNPTNKVMQELIEEVLNDFTPLVQMQASNRNRSFGDLRWEDIGGLFDVKEKLDTIVRHPILYRQIYDKANIRLPRGILLYGPPGCGKSCIVPALAQACNYPLVKVRGPEIFDKYIGASEAKVREMFERATQMAPSILFLDELEALAPRRGSDSTGVTDRVVNQLLTFLDGVEDASMGTVYIVGATSRPDKVDPAIIRPGRLERHLYLGPPESGEEWNDLISRVSEQWDLTPDCMFALSNGCLLQTIRTMPRLGPADIQAAFDTAHLHAVHRNLSNAPVRHIPAIQIELEDMLFGFQQTKPSLNESEANLLDKIYKPFRGKSKSHDEAKSQGEVSTPLKTTFR